MKKKILGIAVIAMLVTTLFVLTGCGKKKEENQPAQEETKKEVKLIEESKNLVYIVKAVGKYTIPKINLAYDNIKELNKEILAYGEGRLNEMTQDGKTTEGGKLGFKHYENDDILSVVYEYESPVGAVLDKYRVWNVDKYTGEVVANEQILEKCKMPVEEFQSKYKEQQKLKYEEINKGAEESQMYNEQYEKTISEENNNINNAMYLNENGEICVITKIYSLAGADYSEYIVTIQNEIVEPKE